MKKTTKTLGLLLVMAVIVSACKKQSIDAPETQQQGELHEVSFRVKSFKQEIVPIASLTAQGGENNLDESIYMIQYVIFDKNDNAVTNKVQYQSDADFGSLSLQLGEGDYKIAAWATSAQVGTSFYMHNSYHNQSYPVMAHVFDELEGYEREQIADAFYQETNFSVTGANTDNELILERKTAKVELRINGLLPDFATRLSVSYLTSSHYLPNQGYYGTEHFNTQFSNLEQYNDNDQYVIPFYVLPESQNDVFTTDVILNFQNDQGGLVYYHIVEGVEVFRNKMTILSGTVNPDDNTNPGFSINIDTSWEDIHREFTF